MTGIQNFKCILFFVLVVEVARNIIPGMKYYGGVFRCYLKGFALF